MDPNLLHSEFPSRSDYDFPFTSPVPPRSRRPENNPQWKSSELHHDVYSHPEAAERPIYPTGVLPNEELHCQQQPSAASSVPQNKKVSLIRESKTTLKINHYLQFLKFSEMGTSYERMFIYFCHIIARQKINKNVAKVILQSNCTQCKEVHPKYFKTWEYRIYCIETPIINAYTDFFSLYKHVQCTLTLMRNCSPEKTH